MSFASGRVMIVGHWRKVRQCAIAAYVHNYASFITAWNFHPEGVEENYREFYYAKIGLIDMSSSINLVCFCITI
jgi:hypothetical protein